MSSATQSTGAHERFRDARTQLEEALSRSSEDVKSWSAGILAGLDELRQGILEHQHLSEGPAGSLSGFRDLKPNLALPIEKAKLEHAQLLEDVESIGEDITLRLASGDASAEHVRRRVGELLHAVARHIEHGSDLLTEALYEEEGGGD